ncbi:MAG TPA: hypothetical protein VEZ70_12300 [Allosphingosinicella sp.]|nr:hypothetical protein [Allosphingosinicella sp.]
MAVRRGRAQARAERDEGEARSVRARIDGFTPDKEAAFLAELERSASLTAAAQAAGISRETARKHRRWRADFDAACKAARMRARGPLEAAAWKRAVEGAETKVIRNGKLVEVRIRPSDSMLRLLLQAADPEKFGRNGGATPSQIALIKRRLEEEHEEETAERRQELIDRLMRKMEGLKRKIVRVEGYGMTLDGDLVPPGYGPVAADAVPMMEDAASAEWPDPWPELKPWDGDEPRPAADWGSDLDDLYPGRGEGEAGRQQPM